MGVCLHWRAMRILSAAWRTSRPKQWTKNLLVVAAPLAAGELLEPGVALSTLLAFVAFCLMSSAVYHVNDVADREADRLHPRKLTRPVASGEISVRTALVVATVLVVLSLAVSWAAATWLVVLVGSYGALQVLYAFWLKHEPVIDIAVVAGGFLMRAVAGGLAASLPISQWFLLVAGFGSLFIVAGKRYSEHVTMGVERETTRSTLAAYSRDYLRYVYTMASAVTLGGYFLWAFEQSGHEGAVPWFELSIGPVVLGILRYALLLEEGYGGAPEDIALGDRPLQVLGLIWLVLFGAGVTVAH
jgi:decaprenyl-phosphate phosphoribosyltransferase